MRSTVRRAKRRYRPSGLQSGLIALPAASILAASLLGCGGSAAATAALPSLTGNWVFTPAAAATAPFTRLSGAIDDDAETAGSSGNTTTAVLQASDSACYAGAAVIPLKGSVQGSQLGLYSFDVNGQYISIAATGDATGAHLTGSYTIAGGCASGASGSLSGQRYSSLTGIYRGAMQNTAALLTLTQSAAGNGYGSFPIAGSGVFTGIPCFKSARLQNGNASILGNQVQMQWTTDDPAGSVLTLAGSIDADADTLTITTATVLGGACAGDLGAASLAKQ